MTALRRKAVFVSLLMLAAIVLTYWFTPTMRTAQTANTVDLEAMTPRQFGDWKVDEVSIQGIVNPQQKELLDSIYSQILSRTYVNSQGRRIMLSLAYGADQSHDKQIHKPEACYPAQGFKITDQAKWSLHFKSTDIPVMRLTAKLGGRTEAITYWIRVGDDVVRGMFEQNKARIKYGFNGVIPDGLLFRISEINGETALSYALQDQFVEDFLTSLDQKTARFFIGLASGQR